MARRGIFYSIVLLLLLFPLAYFILNYASISSVKTNQLVSRVRGSELANFADSTSQDVPRVLEIAGKRAAASAINYIDVNNGAPLQSSNDTLAELMTNNTIQGVIQPVMNGSSIKDWQAKISSMGQLRGFNITVEVLHLNVLPYDAFNINFTAVMRVNITDYEQPINVSRIYAQTAIVPISGFEDPTYSMNTFGSVTRVFSQFPKPAVSGQADFESLVQNGAYVANANGPSFFDRLEGKLSTQAKYQAQVPSTVIGLESMVNITELASKSVMAPYVNYSRTIVDWKYFNASQGIDLYGYAVLLPKYDYERLDAAHNNSYNVWVDYAS